ncbi:acyl-CoA synthetase [Bradyrhizobium japonicum]|uniref:Long-chain-fatty-acid--CoA ligase n=1 Tax=Bradyrhizobium japonicum TaxID=375 RepID=A0A0A3Y6Y4_BRAJP|nr:AMP-binding protein [Bradyrhizobium japonicum]KGT81324.1 acyl-CoA synthetase [Bradyrhizobium japonicum]MCS3893663.1 fatty-acyl-CoA synthase [Bradyrhizobium japonicum USDA 38]MCS3946177.1 fatty-acyl-CoA synthase [Bradyrhizobium japonicum]MCW2221500.1 fatty-acyl-CoA synthase [Bradyrhizobium japonicum]MCW2346112.1 fatty-acyl-CoA synthase [Bradyrhizobium japonicum]
MSANQVSLQSLIGAEGAEPAFVFDGRPVSRAEFSGKVEQTAAWLAAQGIGQGDVVAAWLVNRVEWIALLFAAARCGAIVAAVNTRYRSAEVGHLLKVSGARLMVVEAAFRSIDFAAILAEVSRDEVPALQRLAVVGGDAIAAHWPCARFDAFETSYPPAPPAQDDVDLPVLLYTTSGTTKGPKLVAHSQRTLATHAASVAKALKLSPPRHSLLAMLPFCGTFGMTSLLGFIAAGATTHVLDAFEAASALKVLGEHKITHAFGSDEMFRRILALADTPRPFPHLEVCGFAAFQPGWRELAAEAEARGMRLFGLYGSSEVQALFSIARPDDAFADRIDGGGWPMSPDARVRVRDTETGELAAQGVSGEIEISAPSRFLGYFNNPDATHDAITADGFFRTGDIGRLRGDGAFVYETRAGDAMRLGGFLVAPGEIEDELKACTGVADAQVVAVDLKGQARCVAFVIPAGEPPQQEMLVARLRERLAGYKVPARIYVVDAFPVTDSANGVKIQRTRLRAMAMERIAAE